MRDELFAPHIVCITNIGGLFNMICSYFILNNYITYILLGD